MGNPRIFTFYTKNDYNSKIIKIILFLFTFVLYLTISALFFNDTTMHKIYEEKGNYNLIDQLPNIFYSAIITSIIQINYLVIKFIICFILLFSFLFVFWYYLSCFCAIYRNTQIHLIKDALISFGVSLLYPLGFNLLPGIFRIPALKNKNKKCVYVLSKIIQLI